MKQRVIYVHPKGRFKIVERLALGFLGDERWIREAVPLPPDPSRYITRADWARAYQFQRREEKQPLDKQPAVREPDKQPDIVRLYRQGYSYKEISAKTGISYARVYSFLCNLRGPLKKGYSLDSEEKELIIQFRKKQMSSKSIAKRLNRPLDMVEEYIRGMATS